MGAGQSLPPEVAEQCALPAKDVKKIMKAFKKKANKKTRTVSRDSFFTVYLSVLSSHGRPGRLKEDQLFDLLDVNHDGERTKLNSPFFSFSARTHTKKKRKLRIGGRLLGGNSEGVLTLALLSIAHSGPGGAHAGTFNVVLRHYGGEGQAYVLFMCVWITPQLNGELAVTFKAMDLDNNGSLDRGTTGGQWHVRHTSDSVGMSRRGEETVPQAVRYFFVLHEKQGELHCLPEDPHVAARFSDRTAHGRADLAPGETLNGRK